MFCPFYFWSNIRNRILVSVYITHATITWRGILEPSNHCWFVYSEIFSRIDQILRNASHFPSFCYRKIQISKNISLQASLHDLFFGFVLCSMLLEIFRVALLFICQGALFLLSSATAYLEYHRSNIMSTTFFKNL